MRGRKPKAATSRKSDNKLAVKKGKTKSAKDPNKPKRPPSAFFVFFDEFRKKYKEKNPENQNVAAVFKAGGAKWRAMSDAEKKDPYVNKASKLKAEYQKNQKLDKIQQLPSRIARFLKVVKHAERVGADAPAYLVAVLEYLSAEFDVQHRRRAEARMGRS